MTMILRVCTQYLYGCMYACVHVYVCVLMHMYLHRCRCYVSVPLHMATYTLC
jgi:hypothetical protein